MQFQTSLALTASAAAIAASAASAAVFSTDNFGVFSAMVASAGETVGSATFPTPYISPESVDQSISIGTSYSASVGGVTWTVTASLGGVAQDVWAFPSNAWLGAENPGDDSELVFSFSPGVRAAGGVFFATLKDWDLPLANSSSFSVQLADGTAFEGVTGSAPGFTGFVSDSADITSISVRVASMSGLTTSDLFPVASSLYFAVPAPGAFALLGALGLVGIGGRRR
jgi:hypothetical protein